MEADDAMIREARTFVQLYRDMPQVTPGRFTDAHTFLIWPLEDPRNNAREWWNAYAHALGLP